MEKALFLIKRYIPVKLFKALQPAYHWLLAALSAAWCGWPSNKLIVIGVTGTTGKTTSIYLIAKTLQAADYRVGFTSTSMFGDGKREWLNDKKMTMAGRFFTQKMLRKMVKNNCQYAIIETTSQGIEQFRHKFINYDILVFTGLYPEHIEAHGGFENYKAAKGKLFSHLKNCRTKYADDKKNVVKADNGFKKIEANRIKKIIIANADDQHADYFLNFWAEEKWAYANKDTNYDRFSANSNNENIRVVNYGNIRAKSDGLEMAIDKKVTINLNLLGEYNAANAMNAAVVGLSQGLKPKEIKIGLEKVKIIPGRMEIITPSSISPLLRGRKEMNFTVIIDYAFEPGALKKIYETVLKLDHHKIIHVLGSAGGGRDAARRPKLGALAGEKADLVIITNEDPYDDDPRVIIDQVAAGALNAGKVLNENLFKIEDRRQAIRKALSLAGENDLVLLTGKGSEQAICAANGQKIPWDERKIVREELKLIPKN